MFRLFLAIFCFAIFSLNIFANNTNVTPDLPKFPVSVLKKADVDTLLANDTPEAWEKYAQECKTKALDLAAKQLYDECSSWLYIYCAADLFSKEGKDLNLDIKRTMLLDVPALCDLFEQIKPEDDMAGFCKVLTQIYAVYPDNFKKYLRSAYAVALIYDIPPSVGWPICNTPSDPVPLHQPEEVFNIFIGDPSTFVFPMDKLTIGELIWIFGVAGPLDELRALKNKNIEPFAIEKFTTSIKDDRKRMDRNRYTDWNTNERDFTPQNIMKFGGSPFEKVYCAWRIANANGIPCLFFTEKVGATTYAWLAYMSRPSVWRFDIARAKEAKHSFGRPIDPQTWKTSKNFDIQMLIRRHILTNAGVLSRTFLRVSRMLYDNGKYANAATFATKAVKENPENWEAYIAFINARARFGAQSSELDAFWKKSYEAFRRYPDMCIQMLNFYRENLIALRKSKEADRIFVAEMRGVMKDNAGLGIEIYSEQIIDIFNRSTDKTEVFPYYQDILRNAVPCQNECFKKIVTPLAKLFQAEGDYRSAQKVASMFGSSARDALLKESAKKLYDSMKKPKATKDDKKSKDDEELENSDQSDDNEKENKDKQTKKRK